MRRIPPGARENLIPNWKIDSKLENSYSDELLYLLILCFGIKSCRCDARYVGRTTQRLADRIKQHVPTSIRTKNTIIREQPPRMCKNSNSKMKSDSAIGKHLIENPDCAKTYSDDNFRIIGQARDLPST